MTTEKITEICYFKGQVNRLRNLSGLQVLYSFHTKQYIFTEDWGLVLYNTLDWNDALNFAIGISLERKLLSGEFGNQLVKGLVS